MRNQKKSEITSRIEPWLINIVYPVGANIVLPFYFKKIEITGQENIPPSGAVIVAPTHRSRWDALIVPYATGRLVSKRDLYFMVSANEMKGIQGWIVNRVGGFPVNTRRPGLSTLKHSMKLLSEGKMMVMFPEGGIVKSEKVTSLKPGVARIALDVELDKPEAKIKILPVSVKYSQTPPRRGCNVKVAIGSCLDVAQYNQDDIKENTKNLTEDLKTSLKKLHEAYSTTHE